MRASYRAAIALILLLLGWIPVPSVQASQLAQSGTGWTDVAPGVQYQEFLLPGPVRAYVARMEIVDSAPSDGITNTLETALGRGVLGGLETVRGMAARYDDAISFWGQTWGNRSNILIAVNGSYFGGSDTPENGMVQSGWYAKRFTDLGGGHGKGLERAALVAMRPLEALCQVVRGFPGPVSVVELSGRPKQSAGTDTGELWTRSPFLN